MKGPVASRDPDPRLVEGAKRGDRSCLRALVEAAAPAVRQWALACTGDADDAADLTQDVLILLVRNIGSFRGEARFLTWLYAITRSTALEALRRKGRLDRKMTRWKTEGGQEGFRWPAAGSQPDLDRIRGVVSHFLESLPPRQREVFQMSELQGLSSVEIGEILSLDAGSVRAALFKARRSLRRRILEQHLELVEEYLP